MAEAGKPSNCCCTAFISLMSLLVGMGQGKRQAPSQAHPLALPLPLRGNIVGPVWIVLGNRGRASQRTRPGKEGGGTDHHERNR